MKKFFICLVLIFSLFSLVACNSNSLIADNNISVDDISINKSHIYVDVKSSEILLAQVYPFNATNQNINWKSTNPDIAIVNDGIVTGVGEGRTTVIASSEDGEIEASCIVYVSTQKLNYENIPNNKNSQLSSNPNQSKIAFQNSLISNDKDISTDNTTGDDTASYNIVSEAIENPSKNFYDFYVNMINEIDKIHNEIMQQFKKISNFNYDNLENDVESVEDIKGLQIIYKYNSNGLEETKFENISTENDEGEIIYRDENTLIKKYEF